MPNNRNRNKPRATARTGGEDTQRKTRNTRTNNTTHDRGGKDHSGMLIAVFLIVGLLGIGGYALWRGVLANNTGKEEQKKSVIKRDPNEEERVDMLIGEMSLEQKVAQLFVVTPEALTGVAVATEAGDATREAITTYPVGGLIYFAQNMEDPTQTKELLWNTKVYVKDACGLTPFLCVDEEGGTVARVANNDAFSAENVGNMRDFGDEDDVEGARAAARTTGNYLRDLGFNCNFAPVADITSDPESVMYLRSFAGEPKKVSEFVLAQMDGYDRAGVVCAAKHFPGIGNAKGDSHNERIYSSRTAEQMAEWELIPFQAAVDAQVPMIMVGHLSCPKVGESGSDAPASLNKNIIKGILRDDMGYDGVVITDSLQMEAATAACSSKEQGVRALKAGADMILMPEDFHEAYEGVMDAVMNGKISEDRIDESVRRIIRVKLHMAG